MNKLQTMLANPNVRFKTMGELIADYGTNWMDVISPIIGYNEALSTMTLFQGKVLHNSLVYPTTWKTHFAYGPTSSAVCIDMLTTKQKPKYDSQGNVIKPGMLVKIEYLSTDYFERYMISSNLRNMPGTLTKVLKVFKLNDYIMPERACTGAETWGKIERMCIITELRNPLSGVSLRDAEKMYYKIFKDSKVSAIEIAHRLCYATDIERKVYYKTL